MLTVPNARVSDSGVYYCIATFTDGTDSTQSNDSIVNITGKYVYSPSSSFFLHMILFQMYMFVIVLLTLFVCVSFLCYSKYVCVYVSS